MTIATLLDDVGTATPVIAAIVTVAVVYLRLALKNELATMKSQIYEHLDLKYFARDIIDVRLSQIERRLDNIEGSTECGILKNHKNKL